MTQTGWVLWMATLGFDRPVRERVEAAVAAGCSRLSLMPDDLARAAAEGLPASDLARVLDDAGLELIIDPVLEWFGGPAAVDEALRLWEGLPVAAVSACGPFTPEQVPASELPGRFVALCDRVAEIGAEATLEFMPFSLVPDLRTAWEIVASAARPNGSVVFDTWHFFRSDPDLELLASLPSGAISAVQVSDAPATPAADLAGETFNRLLPGDGELDLLGALRALDALDALRWVGAEVLSPVMASMVARDAAVEATARVRELVARARGGTAEDS